MDQDTKAAQNIAENDQSTLEGGAPSNNPAGQPGVGGDAPSRRPEKPAGKLRGMWRTIAAIGFIVAIAAWIALVFNEYVSGGLAIAGLVMSILGCSLSGRGFWRNIAITGIIACGVLLLVYAIFFFGINYAVKMIG